MVLGNWPAQRGGGPQLINHPVIAYNAVQHKVTLFSWIESLDILSSLVHTFRTGPKTRSCLPTLESGWKPLSVRPFKEGVVFMLIIFDVFFYQCKCL